MTTEKLEPLPIKRLQEALINRIAAGEIIHRPASALKELIENCLDAGSTSIRITAKEGGMKLLQIQDNGCGIRKSDLPILAERFTTSKLSTFSDLSRIATYGFRGEALASISHVARLSVVTKTKSDSCAWRAVYADGALAPLKPGQSPDPKPCAGNDGTVITIEDLFYNTPTRLASLRSTAEEYSRILDVVTKYAIHNPHVSFSCKKAGSTSPDVTTPSGSEVKQTIQLLYGHSIANELMHVTAQKSDDDLQPWEADVLCSNANYQAKKTIFLLFINHRLVECSRMKRALEAVYSAILPKGTFPFIYLSLIVDPSSVDVNVHPTKREVHFLNEEVITERVCDAIQNELGKQSHSRTFQYQKIASQHKVRTCLTDRTLDSMFPVVNQATQPSPPPDAKSHDSPATQSPSPLKIRDIKESECYLTSVLNLRHALIKGKHKQLTEILEKHTFVGIVDLQRSLSLIQHSTKLYLVNNGALSEELFYQLGLRQFGDLSRMKLQPPPSLRSLLQIAVNAEPSTKQSKLTKDQIVDKIFGLLMSRREMLAEYFSLHISSSGSVESLPLLLRDYTPNLDKLPHFLMRLGPQVDWTSETECFDTFFRELAYFYIPGPLPLIGYQANDVDEGQVKAEQWQIQHVLFPAMRRYLCAPQSLLDRDVIQIANLPDLYRVFERC
ncbi:DNA mismatch repair protein [Pleurotus pulmonarius]|nr:DNA mismatch repair protein [Pleurotus pulmonarius]